MWFQFIISFALEALFLFAPGYLAARALRLARPLALGVAPAISCGMLEIWTFAAWKAGIWADWAAIALPVAGFAAVLYAASRFAAHRAGSPFGTVGAGLFPPARTWALALAAFAGAGILTCGIVLVKNLDGPASMFQAYDNLSHMMRIRAFVDTGVFSPIGVDMNYNLPNPPYGDHASGFYPCSWHCIAALSVSLLQAPVALAVNSTNAVFAALAAPIGAWAFLSTALRGRNILPMAVLPLAFSAFPWGMINYGPLYPNMAAFAMLLGVAACFIAAVETQDEPRAKAVLAAVFLAGSLGLALSHPNAALALALPLAPYGCWKIASCGRFVREDGSRSPARWAFAAAFAGFAVLVWAAVLNSPFMSGIVHYDRPPFLPMHDALVSSLLFAIKDTPAQPMLSLLVAAGVLYSARRKRYLWMTASFGIAVAMYVVNASTQGTLKAWLTGFWYQDPYRISALVALCALPLAALGLSVLLRAVSAAVDWISPKLSKPLSKRFATGLALFACTVAIFCRAITIPGFGMIDTAFGYTQYMVSFKNDLSRPDAVLNAAERNFIDRVREVTGPDAVILNHPYDGSAFAAANFDLNVYWRTWGEGGDNSDGEASRTLRYGADKAAQDPGVRAALEESGAEYLMLLDAGTLSSQPFMRHTVYRPENWPGIEAVTDQTPGYQLILSEGDMRLYRITATEGE